MVGASVYILVCSARNKTKQRLRRLREPRYLLGALAGIGYLLFTLGIRQRAYRADRALRRRRGVPGAVTLFGLPATPIGAALLACAALASWVLPFKSGLLDFTQAETSFLFPAPLRRRQLVLHRLLRSQAAVFAGALIMALAYPTGSIAGRLRGLIGVWLVLMTSHVFFTGVTLARSSMRAGTRRLAFIWPAVLVPGAAVGSLVWSLFDASQRGPLQTARAVIEVVVTATERGPAQLFLWPFALLVRPLFAASTADFIAAVGGALAVYAIAVGWLLWADSSSVEAADAVVERQVSGPPSTRRTYVARPVGWELAPSGSVESMFVWKGVLQTFRTVDRRLLVRVLVIVLWMIIVSLLMTRTRGLATIFGIFATWGALFSLFMGPQIVRMDLREDLAHLELIKSWPVTGGAVIRGELIWPTMVITAVTWAFGVAAMAFSLSSLSRIPTPYRASAWVALMLLVPGIVLAQYTMHNAVALLFPAWVPLGGSRLRGVDAVGQRLIMLAANWLGLLLALAPGIAMTAVLAIWLRPFIGPAVLPAGAMLTTLSVIAEMWLVTGALAPVYERLDVTSVERPD
jgi:hypothetical protein